MFPFAICTQLQYSSMARNSFHSLTTGFSHRKLLYPIIILHHSEKYFAIPNNRILEITIKSSQFPTTVFPHSKLCFQYPITILSHSNLSFRCPQTIFSHTKLCLQCPMTGLSSLQQDIYNIQHQYSFLVRSIYNIDCFKFLVNSVSILFKM